MGSINAYCTYAKCKKAKKMSKNDKKTDFSSKKLPNLVFFLARSNDEDIDFKLRFMDHESSPLIFDKINKN